jgi:hypothetical protein
MSEYFDGAEVLAVTKDGKAIAKAWRSQVLGSGTNPIVVRVPDLKYIDAVLEVEFSADPDTYLTHEMGRKITGNVVGMTIYGLAAGTTLTTTIVAIGPC